MAENVAFQIQVDPEQVNRAVAEAVLHSAIGGAMKKAVEKHVADLTTRAWDNPVEACVKQTILEEVSRLVRDEHASAIRQSVRTYLTSEKIGEITITLWKKVMEQTTR